MLTFRVSVFIFRVRQKTVEKRRGVLRVLALEMPLFSGLLFFNSPHSTVLMLPINPPPP